MRAERRGCTYIASSSTLGSDTCAVHVRCRSHITTRRMQENLGTIGEVAYKGEGERAGTATFTWKHEVDCTTDDGRFANRMRLSQHNYIWVRVTTMRCNSVQRNDEASVKSAVTNRDKLRSIVHEAEKGAKSS